MLTEHAPSTAAEAEFYVYVHLKADSREPFYVGKGKARRAWSGSGRNAWWRRIVAKHGLAVMVQRHFLNESDAFASEVETIAVLRDLGYELCNLTDGGEGSSGAVRSHETRAKLSAAKSTPTARRILSENAIKRWASPEARAALSDKMSGEANPSCNLSDDSCRRIFQLRIQGLTQCKIAAYLNCGQAQVSKILSGKKRREIYLEFHPEEH